MEDLLKRKIVNVNECKSKKYGLGTCVEFDNGVKIYPIFENSIYPWIQPLKYSGKIKKDQILNIIDVKNNLIGSKLVHLTRELDSNILTFQLPGTVPKFVEFEADDFIISSPITTTAAHETKDDCDFITQVLQYHGKCLDTRKSITELYENIQRYIVPFMSHLLFQKKQTSDSGELVIEYDEKKDKASIISSASEFSYRASILKKMPFYIDIGLLINGGIGHANILLIQPSQRRIELFEPHGTELHTMWTRAVLKTLANYFYNFEESNVEFHTGEMKIVQTYPFRDYSIAEFSVNKTCPSGLGWQTKTGDAKCAAWSSLYAILYLLCPTFNFANRFPNNDTTQLTILIDAWICYIYKYISENRIKDTVDEFKYLIDELNIKPTLQIVPFEITNISNLINSGNVDRAFEKILEFRKKYKL